MIRSRSRRDRTGEHIVLRDGSAALVRPIGSGDAALLADGFSRLSPHSRRARFLMAKNQLSATELRYLTDIDHYNHEAIGAIDPGEDRGVGVARYVRSTEDRTAAEVAVTVVDAWHGRGLGTALVNRLIVQARAAGIVRFTALVADDNLAILGLLRKLDADVELVSLEDGTAEYDIALRPDRQARTALVSRTM